MSSNEARGTDYIAQAEAKLKSASGFFGRMFGGTSKQEEAMELYGRAANAFKMAKKWSAAGQAFSEAANIAERLQMKHDSAQSSVDAANCYKKSESDKAITCLLHAIEIFTDMGRFSMAAKHHMAVAEIYETEHVDIDQCIANYEQAADYYRGEESNSAANKCLLKVAFLSAQQEKYERAIEIYEQVGASCLESQLLKYSAKDHFFRAALLHICVDAGVDGPRALDKYTEMFPAFQDSREFKLLRKILDAIEEQSVDAFTDAVKEYDSISRLDQWYTGILLKIKKAMTAEEGEELR
ncbi:alpha-soluble NSF attachment protein-like isoform X1 [Oscarella lobularis]|uniref:alpha-soluble NSF attachment protein-like isoform X1 n=1 Tax=Oscarella lobularis TaxID=121494 RepID=UPI003313557B